MIIASDFFSPIGSLRLGLGRLRHDRHEIIALRVIHPDEIEFPFRNWTHFRGLEHESGSTG